MGWNDNRHVPPPGSVLCRVDSIPDGGCHELRYGPADTGLSLFAYRGASGVRVYVNNCPHQCLPLNARLDRFLLLAKEQIMCAYHCAVFRLADGRCVDGPAAGMGLEPVPFEVKQGYIHLGDASPAIKEANL